MSTKVLFYSRRPKPTIVVPTPSDVYNPIYFAVAAAYVEGDSTDKEICNVLVVSAEDGGPSKIHNYALVFIYWGPVRTSMAMTDVTDHKLSMSIIWRTFA